MWRIHRPTHFTVCSNSLQSGKVKRLAWNPRPGVKRRTHFVKKPFIQKPNNNKPRTYRFNGKTNGHRKPSQLFGTWNVQIMFQPGAALSVVKEVEKYSQDSSATENQKE